MKYSAKNAAKEVGKSIPTITRAIKSGKLSAEKNKQGGYIIEASELFRVFPPKGNKTEFETPVTPPSVKTDIRHEVSVLREQIKRIDEMNARERSQLEAQIEDLRRDRDKWQELAEKQTDTVKLLTHQQDEIRKSSEKARKGLWTRLTGLG